MTKTLAAAEPHTHRSVLAIAVPVMLSNVSTALIGIVDTGIVGQVPDPAYIGAVAVGSLVFLLAFWAFSFLRMGTTGLTAQALGAGNAADLGASLARALILAVGIGTVLVVLQWPIRELAMHLLEGSARVEALAAEYFDVRIWAAPATLANYALLGWFIGLGRTDIGLVLQLVLNVTNMVLDAVFVLALGWGVEGVAAGTLLAECLAAMVGIAIAIQHVRRNAWRIAPGDLLDATKLRRTLAVNRDIMVRSLALIFVFVWFMSRGAADGDVTLAANAILMQLITVSAFFLDGLAFAAEALVGRSMGAEDRRGLSAAMRLTTFWAAVTALIICVALFSLGAAIIDFLTVDNAARKAAREFLPWAAAAPLLGVWAFQLDGVFIGATRTVAMRNAMLLSSSIFLVSWWILLPFGNHGLWGALYINYCARIGTLAYCLPALLRSVPERD